MSSYKPQIEWIILKARRRNIPATHVLNIYEEFRDIFEVQIPNASLNAIKYCAEIVHIEQAMDDTQITFGVRDSPSFGMIALTIPSPRRPFLPR